MKTANHLLPDRPSEGILACLKDLEKLERNKRYAIDMRLWHDHDTMDKDCNQVCSVCLGGARMAMILDNPMTTLSPDGLSPSKLGLPNEKELEKILSMDCFRQGYVWPGLESYLPPNEFEKIHVDKWEELWNIQGEYGGSEDLDYDISPSRFKKTIRKMALELKAIGL